MSTSQHSPVPQHGKLVSVVYVDRSSLHIDPVVLLGKLAWVADD